MVLGFYSLRDLLTILSASEDSRSLMGGSDVVHCVRVPLTSTTMAVFCGIWERGWDWFMLTLYLLLCTILWTIGSSSIVVCNGPTS